MRSALSTMLAGIGHLVTVSHALRTADDVHHNVTRQAAERLATIGDSDMRDAAIKASNDVATRRRKARRAILAGEIDAFRESLPELMKRAQAELAEAAKAVRTKPEVVAPFPDLAR